MICPFFESTMAKKAGGKWVVNSRGKPFTKMEQEEKEGVKSLSSLLCFVFLRGYGATLQLLF